ncbi:hypothetical protein EMCRGX_G000858 [Ephydatia muelleri]
MRIVICFISFTIDSYQATHSGFVLGSIGIESFSCDALSFEPLSPGDVTTCNCTATSPRWNFRLLSSNSIPPCGRISTILQNEKCPSGNCESAQVCGAHLSAVYIDAAASGYISTLTITAHPTLNGLIIECLAIDNRIIGHLSITVSYETPATSQTVEISLSKIQFPTSIVLAQFPLQTAPPSQTSHADSPAPGVVTPSLYSLTLVTLVPTWPLSTSEVMFTFVPMETSRPTSQSSDAQYPSLSVVTVPKMDILCTSPLQETPFSIVPPKLQSPPIENVIIGSLQRSSEVIHTPSYLISPQSDAFKDTTKGMPLWLAMIFALTVLSTAVVTAFGCLLVIRIAAKRNRRPRGGDCPMKGNSRVVIDLASS